MIKAIQIHFFGLALCTAAIIGLMLFKGCETVKVPQHACNLLSH
jgi:hypothetical protein